VAELEPLAAERIEELEFQTIIEVQAVERTDRFA